MCVLHHEEYMRTLSGTRWMRSEGFKARVNHPVIKGEEDCLRFTDIGGLGSLKY